MNGALVLREPLGERVVAATAFPLAIGGPGADLVVPGAAGTQALLAEHDGQLYVQPAGESAILLHNGAGITGSVWLRSGDVLDVGGGRLRLRLEDGRRVLEVIGGADNATAPPAAVASTGIAGSGPDEDEHIEPVAFRAPSLDARPVAGRRVPWRGIAVAASLAVLGLVATLIFTSVPIEVEIQPGAERLRFEGGWPGLRLGENHLLRPGSYVIIAEHEGYAPLRAEIDVAKDGERQFRFELKPLPGRLEVRLPVPGEVQVDGRVLGQAPGPFELEAGRHTIRIDTERYLDHVVEVEMLGLGRSQSIEPELTPGWAAVSVATEPAEAEVLVDGQPRGRTPLSLDLMAGSHRIELRREGFKAWLSDVAVQANQPLTLGPVQLGLPDGRLVVRSVPVGASVTIGGAYRGRTPLEIDVRPGISQAVAVQRDGYEPAGRDLAVEAGERVLVEFDLEPILGEVIVRAKPADAKLLIDGVARGVANQTLSLPSTAHVIEIRRAGYQTHKVTVTPRPGLPQNVEVTLLEGIARDSASGATQAEATGTTGTAATANAAAASSSGSAAKGLASTVRTRAGQEMKLVPAGEYTMGSARREAGRRANEAQRPVRLERRFYLATREVTNAEFRQFRPSHRSGYVLQSTLELDRQPVVNVSWQDAAAYANWLSAQEGFEPAYVEQGGRLVPVVPATTGYRLPTEAEWEWVARGAGSAPRKYPWGDSLPVPGGAGNFADRNAQPLVGQVLGDYDDGYAATAPVASFTASPAGFFDMGGNVAEWTHDLYTVQPPASGVAVDPAAAGAGSAHVIRGSSWQHSGVTELRSAYRDYGDGKRNDLGFRIARYAQ